MSSRNVEIVLSGKDKASDDIKRVERALGGIETAGNRLRASMVGVGTAFAGVFAADKLISFGKAALDEFIEAEEASRRLDLTLKNLGSGTSVTRQLVDEMADSIHRTTVFEDDAAVAASRHLLAVQGLSRSGFREALRTSTDLAAQLGGDLPSAADLLSRALANPETAAKKLRAAEILLTDAEVEKIKAFDKAGQSAEAMAAIMEAVQSRVAGAAQEMASSTKGAIEQMKKDFADMKEFAGTGIAPVVNMLGEVARDLRSRFTPSDPLIEQIRQLQEREAELKKPKLARLFDTSVDRSQIPRMIAHPLTELMNRVNWGETADTFLNPGRTSPAVTKELEENRAAQKRIRDQQVADTQRQLRERQQETMKAEFGKHGNWLGKQIGLGSNALGDMVGKAKTAGARWMEAFGEGAKQQVGKQGILPPFFPNAKWKGADDKAQHFAEDVFHRPVDQTLQATESRMLTRAPGYSSVSPDHREAQKLRERQVKLLEQVEQHLKHIDRNKMVVQAANFQGW